jgi:hypothetical protein
MMASMRLTSCALTSWVIGVWQTGVRKDLAAAAGNAASSLVLLGSTPA